MISERGLIAIEAMGVVPPPENDVVSQGRDIDRFVKDCYAVADAFLAVESTPKESTKAIESFKQVVADADIRDRIRDCLETFGSFTMARDAQDLLDAMRKSGLDIKIVGPRMVQP